MTETTALVSFLSEKPCLSPHNWCSQYIKWVDERWLIWLYCRQQYRASWSIVKSVVAVQSRKWRQLQILLKINTEWHCFMIWYNRIVNRLLLSEGVPPSQPQGFPHSLLSGKWWTWWWSLLWRSWEWSAWRGSCWVTTNVTEEGC